MSAALLAELKKLQHQRSDSSPFAGHIEFLQWADNVSSRLSFDPPLQSSFKSRIRTATIQHSGGRSNTEQINEAIGLLNQAVLLLETPPFQSVQPSEPVLKTQLEAPQKVTVKWLYEHVPLTLFLGGVAMLVSAFVAGMTFSQSQFYAFIRATIATPSTASLRTNGYNKENASITSPTIQPPAKK